MRRLHRRLLLSLTPVLLAAAATPAAAAARVAVIVSRHARGLHPDRAQLRNIYLKKVFIDADGHRLVPVNLPPEAPLRRAFLDTVVHMSVTGLQDYWNRQYFQGVSPPYVLASQQAVVEFVARTPGAIGYVRPCFVDAGVRTVLTLTLSDVHDPDRLGRCPANHR